MHWFFSPSDVRIHSMIPPLNSTSSISKTPYQEQHILTSSSAAKRIYCVSQIKLEKQDWAV